MHCNDASRPHDKSPVAIRSIEPTGRFQKRLMDTGIMVLGGYSVCRVSSTGQNLVQMCSRKNLKLETSKRRLPFWIPEVHLILRYLGG